MNGNTRTVAGQRDLQRRAPLGTGHGSRGRMLIICTVAIAAFVLASWLHGHGSREIVGHAYVVDGDTVVVARTRIRLYGIDAPESHQTCNRAGRQWACGMSATAALKELIADRELTCHARVHDRYGRTVATCTARGADLGAEMVKTGNAISYGAYHAEEHEAREARRGIWSSSFDRPSDWRAHHKW
jgi:endonuclease YncB( thermonuclease family)